MDIKTLTISAALGMLAFGAGGPVGAQEYDGTQGYDGTTVQDELAARIWFDRGEEPVVQRGDRVRIYYRTTRDAYVAIFNIDTNGTVRLVYPRSPTENHFVRGGRDYRLLFPRSPYWYVDDPAGLGYYFVVASPEPFDFSSFDYSYYVHGWDLTRVGRSVYRDPYVAMDDYVAALIPDWEYVPYALDFSSYHVGEQRYDYPRFMCYDCHGFTPVSVWNPYHYACTNFRVVVYDDPYFYPAYRYRADRVVYVRPVGPHRPRFSFKERADDEPATPLVATRATAGSNGSPPSVIRRPVDSRAGVRPVPKEGPSQGALGRPARPDGDRAGRPGARVRVRPSDLLPGRGVGGSSVRPPTPRRSGEAGPARPSTGRERSGGTVLPRVDARGRPVLERRSRGEAEEKVRPPVRRPTREGASGRKGEGTASSKAKARVRPPRRGGGGGGGGTEGFTPTVRDDDRSSSRRSGGFRPLVGGAARPPSVDEPTRRPTREMNGGSSRSAPRAVARPAPGSGGSSTRGTTAGARSTAPARTGTPSALLRSRRGATTGRQVGGTVGAAAAASGAGGAARTPAVIKRGSGGVPSRAPVRRIPSASSRRPPTASGSTSSRPAVRRPEVRTPPTTRPTVRTRGGGASATSGSRAKTRGGSKARVKRRGGGGGG